MKYFKLIEELDIDGDKNPDGFLINLCTLDKNNIIYLKSKYLTFVEYNKLKLKKKGGSENSNNIIIYRSMLIKNPDIINIFTSANPNRTIIIVNDDDKKLLPEKKELNPSQLRELAQKTIDTDTNNKISPQIKKQLKTIAHTKNDKDLIITELEKKIDTVDKDNEAQKNNDIKQMKMLQHMQLMNMSNQAKNNDNNNNNGDSFFSNMMSGLGIGFGVGIGSALATSLFSSFMSGSFFSYDYGFNAEDYYPNFYDNSSIIEEEADVEEEAEVEAEEAEEAEVEEVEVEEEAEVDFGFGDFEF